MVTLLTPTRNRALSFDIVQQWMERQTYKGEIQWIVVNDGAEDYDYWMNQEVIKRKPTAGERHSLCENIIAGLPHVKGEVVLFIEDDDYFAPSYVEKLVESLRSKEIAGSMPAFYYHLRNRVALQLSNFAHASLGQTGVRASSLHVVKEIAEAGNPYIDLDLWKRLRRSSGKFINPATRDIQHISMKGLPGEKGVSPHHVTMGGHLDLEFAAIKELIGADFAPYEQLLWVYEAVNPKYSA